MKRQRCFHIRKVQISSTKVIRQHILHSSIQISRFSHSKKYHIEIIFQSLKPTDSNFRQFNLLPGATAPFLLLILLLVQGCSHKVIRVYENAQDTPVSPQARACNPVITFQTDIFGLPSIYAGSVILDQSGFTLNCSREDAFATLREEACSQGANLVKIIEERKPDIYSSCYRCAADFHYIHNLESYESILGSKLRTIVYYNQRANLRWDDFLISDFSSHYSPIAAFIDLKVIPINRSQWSESYREYRVTPAFYSDVSRVFPDYRNDNSLLLAEMMFDLAYIYSTELEQRLNQSEPLSDEEIHEATNSARSDYFKEQYQLYEVTEFGKNRDELSAAYESIQMRLREADS